MKIAREFAIRVCLFAISAVLAGTSLAFFVPALRTSAAPTNDEIRNCSGEAKLLAGSGWFGGKGVNICSNGSSYGNNWGNNEVEHPSEAIGLVDSGYKWQCVELINRFYIKQGWISSRWVGNAYQMYDNAPASFEKSPQGSITHIEPGDVIVMTGGWGGFGHVGIVSSVGTNTDGTWKVNTVNQNAGDTVVFTTKFHPNTKKLDAYFGSDFSVKGVVHRPGSSSGGGSGDSTGLASPSLFTASNGNIFLAGVNEDGKLYNRKFTSSTGTWGDEFSHGTGWATNSSPSITIDNGGRVWIAAVNSSGVLKYRYLDTQWQPWDDLTTGVSVDAGVTMVPRTNGNVSLIMVKTNGNIHHATMTTTSETVSSAHFSGDWSKDSQPGLTVDTSGTMWAAAVKDYGRLYVWKIGISNTLHPHDFGDHSTTSGVDLVARSNGNVTAAAISDTGQLLYRTYSFGETPGSSGGVIGAQFSQQSNPGITVDVNGELWAASVKSDNHVYSYWYTAGVWIERDMGGGTLKSAGLDIQPRTNGPVTLSSINTDEEFYHRTWDWNAYDWGTATVHNFD